MVGQTISHYKVTAELGRGGMGVFYGAEDRSLKRPGALKFLRSDVLDDEGHKARFLREAQAVASLIHPNVCVSHEIDESEGSPVHCRGVGRRSDGQRMDQGSAPKVRRSA